MLQLVQKLYKAVVVPFHRRGDIHLHEPARIRRVLVKRNRVRMQAGSPGQRAQVLADGGVARAGGMEMRSEEFVPLLLVGGQFRLEPFEAGIVGAILLLEGRQLVQIADANVRRAVQLPLHAEQHGVSQQDHDENAADDVVAMLDDRLHLKSPNTPPAGRARRDRAGPAGSGAIRSKARYAKTRVRARATSGISACSHRSSHPPETSTVRCPLPAW